MAGFHSSTPSLREVGVGYVMLLNSNYMFRGYFEIRALLFSYLTQGRTFTRPRAPKSRDRPGADYFALGNPRNEVFGFIDRARHGWRVFEATDGSVRVDDIGGWTLDLVPTADGAYRQPGECGSSVRFTTNRDGTPVMIMSFMYGAAAAWWAARIRYATLAVTMLL